MNQYPTTQPSARPQTPVKKSSGVAVASLVCGIIGFFFNPLYFVTLAAVVTGIIGIATAENRPKGNAVAGLVLGICAGIIQFIGDLILSIFTFGLSFFI